MAGSAASAAIEKLNEPGVEKSLLSGPIKNGGAVCECMLLSMSSSLFELLKKNKNFNFFLFSLFSASLRELTKIHEIFSILFGESNGIPLNIYLSDPLPSLPPKYLMSWSPTESLL